MQHKTGKWARSLFQSQPLQSLSRAKSKWLPILYFLTRPPRSKSLNRKSRNGEEYIYSEEIPRNGPREFRPENWKWKGYEKATTGFKRAPETRYTNVTQGSLGRKWDSMVSKVLRDLCDFFSWYSRSRSREAPRSCAVATQFGLYLGEQCCQFSRQMKSESLEKLSQWPLSPSLAPLLYGTSSVPRLQKWRYWIWIFVPTQFHGLGTENTETQSFLFFVAILKLTHSQTYFPWILFFGPVREKGEEERR